MSERLRERLQQLQTEYDAGQKMLAELDQKRQSLTTTLLRIEGAMQVLRELIEPDGATDPAPNGAEASPPAS